MTAVMLLALPFAQIMGGYTPCQPSEVAPGSHIHSLAAFAITSLTAQANSLDLQGLEFGSLERAEHQTVAGTNYRGTVSMLPQGSVTFTVWEQTWTNSLSLTAATFSPSSFSNARLDLLGGRPLSLDATAFAAFEASSAQRYGARNKCDGGKEWNECGSSCTPTCDSPSPMCAMVCVAKCECPRGKPIFENGKCIAQAACATAQLATATATSFNCFTREMWSAEKTAWCCEHRNLGCPTPTAAATLGANGHGQYHGADGASVPSPADEGGNTEQPPVLGASRESAPESIVADQDVPPENGSQAALAAGTSAAAISPAANALCIVIAIVAAGSVVALCKRRCSGPATRTRLADEKASPSKSHEMNAPSAISTASNIA